MAGHVSAKGPKGSRDKVGYATRRSCCSHKTSTPIIRAGTGRETTRA
jgi:hypothetical protein